MTIIETERLHIRELSAETDAAFVIELFNTSDFLRFIGDRKLRTTDDGVRYIQEQITRHSSLGFALWAVELRDSCELVGICGLLRRPPIEDVEIGFGFLERFYRRGYAFEAAEAVMNFGSRTLGLTRIAAVTHPENRGSIKVLEKLGMQFEGMIDLPGYETKRMLFVRTWE